MPNQKLKIIKDDEPWYKNGLPFKCTECGQCCTGAPGYAWVTEREMEAIADYLNMPLKKFRMRYTRLVGHRYALVELKKKNYACIFLKDMKCTVYPVRPKQCRTYPWWPENLNSLESWRKEAERCEGMRCREPIVNINEIETTLNEHISSEETVS